MLWKANKLRCVRRFALFPIIIYDPESDERITVWLEFYYAVQCRDIHDADCSHWVNLRLASKEEYIEWNKKENK